MNYVQLPAGVSIGDPVGLCIVCENCDEACFDWQDVIEFCASDVRISEVKTGDHLCSFKTINKGRIVLSASGEVEHYVFGKIPSGISEVDWLMSAHDIAQIELKFDQVSYPYYVAESAHILVQREDEQVVLNIE